MWIMGILDSVLTAFTYLKYKDSSMYPRVLARTKRIVVAMMEMRNTKQIVERRVKTSKTINRLHSQSTEDVYLVNVNGYLGILQKRTSYF